MKKITSSILKICFAATAVITAHSAFAYDASRPTSAPARSTLDNHNFPYSMPINPNAARDGKPYLKAHDDVMTLAGATLPPARPVKPTAPPPQRAPLANQDFPYSMPINPNAANDGKPYLKAHDDVMTLAGATLPPARPVKPTAPPPSKPVGNNGDFPYSMPIDGNVSIPDSGVMSTASQPPARPIGKPIAPPPSKPVVNNGNFPYSEPIYGKRTSTTPVSVMTTADVPPAYNPNNAVAKPQYTVKNSVRVADADNLKNKEILFVIDRIEGKGERVIRERRINQIELFSLNTEDGKGKGLLTVGKIPTASGNVFFGEWAPASEAAATAHVKGNAHPAWFYGKNPTGSTKGLATATYNVVGVNGHKAGERDIYTGTVKAYFGSGDSGSMTGKLARHTDTLDFAGVKIDNRNGTFASDAARNREGIKGQFYGQNAAALAGIATRGTESRADDISFGGIKQ